MADKSKKKQGKTIVLSNLHIYLLRQSPSIGVLMAATDIPKPAKLKIYKFFFSLMDRPEAKALHETVDEIVAEWTKEDPEAILPSLNDPVFDGIFDKDSGIEIKKLQLSGKEIPDAISSADMMGLTWLIEFGE